MYKLKVQETSLKVKKSCDPFVTKLKHPMLTKKHACKTSILIFNSINFSQELEKRGKGPRKSQNSYRENNHQKGGILATTMVKEAGVRGGGGLILD